MICVQQKRKLRHREPEGESLSSHREVIGQSSAPGCQAPKCMLRARRDRKDMEKPMALGPRWGAVLTVRATSLPHR